MNLIAQAVEPLKTQAMDRAEKCARSVVEDVRKQLAKNNNDVRACAPYPSSRLGRREYMQALAKYQTFDHLTTWRDAAGVHYRAHHDPLIVDVDAKKVSKFVKESREQAAFQFEVYVEKLNKKIGAVSSARLSDTYSVWNYSLLHVQLPAGDRQIWKTRIIVNVSKLGKVFNQFPTRLMKASWDVKGEN